MRKSYRLEHSNCGARGAAQEGAGCGKHVVPAKGLRQDSNILVMQAGKKFTVVLPEF